MIEGEYVDRGESARSSDRTELQRMVEEVVASGTIDYVIVHKLDRFARNRVDDALMTMALQKAGARLISCSENIDDTPSGTLLHGIMASISEFYSKNLASEVRKGFEQKVKGGGTPTRAKLGYPNARETTADGRNVGIIQVDPQRAPLIRLAFELYATNDYSFATLCEVLAAKGLRSRPTRKHQGLPLTTSQIDRILKDPYYLGIVTYKGVKYVGSHRPLISEDLFLRVQGIIRAHAVSGDKRRIHHHWLKGTVFCGSCGKRLIFTKTRNRQGQIYEYFYCVGRQHYERACRQGWMPVEAVEDAVVKHYRTIQLSPERSQQIRAHVLARIEAMEGTAGEQQARQQAAIDRIETEQLRLVQAHGAGAVPLKLLVGEQERLASELRTAEAALRSTQLQFADIRATFAAALDKAGDPHGAYVEATPEVRRKMDQLFFKRILIDDGETPSVSAATVAGPFGAFLTDDLFSRPSKSATHSQTTTEAPSRLVDDLEASWRSSEPRTFVLAGQGSKDLVMAEGEGFEPLMDRSGPEGSRRSSQCVVLLLGPRGGRTLVIQSAAKWGWTPNRSRSPPAASADEPGVPG